VPAGTARLRMTFTAQHPDDEIARLASIVRDKIAVA
jgi:7-keto-8-aminopelargonate synthetase-like enzyme